MKSVNHRSVIDGKGEKLPKEPEMKRLKDVFGKMREPDKKRTKDYLRSGGETKA